MRRVTTDQLTSVARVFAGVYYYVIPTADRFAALGLEEPL
jgi:hypothetical protein